MPNFVVSTNRGEKITYTNERGEDTNLLEFRMEKKYAEIFRVVEELNRLHHLWVKEASLVSCITSQIQSMQMDEPKEMQKNIEVIVDALFSGRWYEFELPSDDGFSSLYCFIVRSSQELEYEIMFVAHINKETLSMGAGQSYTVLETLLSMMFDEKEQEDEEITRIQLAAVQIA